MTTFQEDARDPQRFGGRRLLQDLAAGVVLAPITIVVGMSLASLAYAGTPDAVMAQGVGFVLVGTLIFNLIMAWRSMLPGAITLPQDSPAAIIGVVTAGIVASMGTAAAESSIFATIVAAVVMSSLATGLLLILLGTLHLGNIVRYLPYPVVGGFLAGTGTLIVAGALRTMVDVPVSLLNLPALFAPDQLMRWVPGLIVGIALIFVLRKFPNFLLFPAVLVAAGVVFYLVAWWRGVPPALLWADGWLLGPFPEGALWHPLWPAQLGQIDWGALRQQAGNLLAVPMIAIISLLLNASGLELSLQRDLDFNHELRVGGLSNVVAGLSGSHVGYPAVSLTTLAYRMRAGTRATTLFVALITLAALVFGAGILSFVPRFVLGGIVFFIGIDFLHSWLYDMWFRMSKVDYALLIVIVIAINAVGLVAGVGLGFLVAMAIFVFDYSRIAVVKRSQPGSAYQSTVDRPEWQREHLLDQGDRIYVCELQGYIFFGTANRLFDHVRGRVTADQGLPLHYLILDFEHVHGIDASAAASFNKMKQLAERHGFFLVFTSLDARAESLLRQDVLTEATHPQWQVFQDLDHGLEWCEEQVLAHRAETRAELVDPGEILAVFLGSAQQTGTNGAAPETRSREQVLAHALLNYMDRRELQPGDVLFPQDAPPPGLFFLVSGQLTAQIMRPDAAPLRMRTMRAGVVAGELSFYAKTHTSASIVADSPSVVYHLPTATLDHLAATNPVLAAALHQALAQLISKRLISATNTIRSLRS